MRNAISVIEIVKKIELKMVKNSERKKYKEGEGGVGSFRNPVKLGR